MRTLTKGLALALLGLALAGCSTTRFQAQWLNPAYAGKPVTGKVLVAGVMKDITLRRVYEDAMVAQLQARGLQAVPAYTLVPELAADSAAAIERAARQAGAAVILSSTLVARDQETLVTTAPPPYPGVGWGGLYGYYWGWGYAPITSVQTYDVYLVSSTVAAVDSGTLIWSGLSRTVPSNDLAAGVRSFAQVLTQTLIEARIL
jgi:hypothetical protein